MPLPSTNPLYGVPRVGGDILFSCTRCKMELAHVIISMVEGLPAKIQCKTCKSERKYRRAALRSTKGKSAARRPRLNTSAMWEEKLAANPNQDAVAYSPKSNFKNGDVLNHPKFGVGIVEEQRGKGKVLVLFREGERILVHQME